MRRVIDIETLLGWAFCDELPKVDRAGGYGPIHAGGVWASISAQGMLMAAAVSDGRPNDYGVLPLLSGMDEPPHPDALRLGDLVRDLDGVAFTLPADWMPFADMPGIAAEAAFLTAEARATLDGAEGVAINVRQLVTHHAIMGGAPDWRGGPIERTWQSYDNGKPKWFRREARTDALGLAYEAEVIAYQSRKTGRHPVDAYRKPLYRPRPDRIARRRAEYQVWLTALDVLCDGIDQAPLEDLEVTRSGRAMQPWIDGGGEMRRTLEPVGCGDDAHKGKAGRAGVAGRRAKRG